MHIAHAPRPLLALIALLALASCKREIEIPVDPPEARKDYARTALDTAVTLAPLANDFDPDGGVLTVVAIGTPAHGTAVLNPDGTVLYTPSAGYTGGDSFTVTIRDSKGNEVTDSAYITVGTSSRFLYVSNFVDFFTRQLYLSDSNHPGVALPVSARFPITEGPVRPFQGLPASGGSIQFVQSADGEAVLYYADNDSDRSVINLFYVDLARPGVATALTEIGEGETLSFVVSPAITPDKQYAFYISNEFNPNAFELVRVEVANPANRVRMNEPVTSHDTVSGGTTTTTWGTVNNFKMSPDGTQLLYVEFDPNSGGPGVGAREIHLIDVTTPGTSTVVSGTPTANTLGATTQFDFVDDDRAIYIATEGTSTFFDLYLVDLIALSAPVKLSGTSVEGGVSSYRISADASRIVYTGVEHTVGVTELYTATFAAPGISTRVSKPRTDASTIGQYLIGHDNSFVIYTRDDDTADVSELYKTDFATPTVQTKLNHTLRVPALATTQEQVLQIQLSAGAPRTVIYSTNDNFVLKQRLTQTTWKASVDAPGTDTAIGTPTSVQYLVLWSHDGDNLTKFDDPESISVISAFRTLVSAPTTMVKQTPERFPGALTEVSLQFPFLP